MRHVVVLASLVGIIAASPLAQNGSPPSTCTSVADVVSILQNNVFGASHCSSVLTLTPQTSTTTSTILRPASRTVITLTTGTSTSTASVVTIEASTSILTAPMSTTTQTLPLSTQISITTITTDAATEYVYTGTTINTVNGCLVKRNPVPVPQAYLKNQLARYPSSKVSAACKCYMSAVPASTRWITARTTVTPTTTSTTRVVGQATYTPTSTITPLTTTTPVTTVTETPITTEAQTTITTPTTTISTITTIQSTEPCAAPSNFVQNPSFDQAVKVWGGSGDITGNGVGSLTSLGQGSNKVGSQIYQTMKGAVAGKPYIISFSMNPIEVITLPGVADYATCDFWVLIEGRLVWESKLELGPSDFNSRWREYGPFNAVPLSSDPWIGFSWSCRWWPNIGGTIWVDNVYYGYLDETFESNRTGDRI